MIDESGQIATLGGIHNVICIDSKQIGGSNALLFVPFLTDIRDDRSDHLTDVFDDHFVSTNILFSEETPVVNCGFAKRHVLATELKI